MKKFLNHRVLPFVCVFSMLVSLIVVPASAGNFGGSVELEFPAIRPEAFFDESGELLESELNRLFADNSNDHCAYFSEFAYIANKNNWAETSKENLTLLAYHWNVTYGSKYSSTATVDKHILDDGTELEFVRVVINDSRLGGSRNNWTWCLNDGAGKILVALPDEDDSITARGQWLQVNQTSATRVEMLPHDVLFNAAQDLGCSLFRMGNYWVIKKTMGVAEYVYSNADGERFVAQYEEEKWATNQDRPQTNITEDGDIVEGDLIKNDIGIDLSGMTVTLPDGTLNLIDKLIYDESTKTYYIDSHDTYNTENNYYVTNNYSWTYHINYTSITYIGQTEEYNKYYEVYYELPDGRDSADLTKEDLEQLNLSVDVIPYGRSADDTSLRSLYHFDGDTKDSSYWNYCTDFTWNKGASLTYMDAGVFDGALYLDETEHQFTLTLPSHIGSQDFTLQFRYYQSATPAPQTDSSITMSGTVMAQFDGASIKDTSGNVLASVPIGSWNEIAVIRSNGTVYLYLNGLSVGSFACSTIINNQIQFTFGSAQQTFKYFDELRVLNYAFVSGGSSYEPSAVPHDTNLALVLPDSAVPVADEYWSITSSKPNLLHGDFSQGSLPTGFRYNQTSHDPYELVGEAYAMNARGEQTSLYVADNYVTVTRNTSDTYSSTSYGSWYGGVFAGFSEHQSSKLVQGLPAGTYTLSAVMRDGSIYSNTFTYEYKTSAVHTKQEFDWGTLGFYSKQTNSYKHFRCTVYALPKEVGSSFDLVYMELVEGDSTDLKAEWVTSVTGIDTADLNTPTLAVRTDIDITSYQIGGVRPSIPEKGQVWAMVENDRIVSIQIYNGQAWEGVDGRIWTGQRWIPASSYNIITLQDMYDIVDATPNYEYIYSEAGFWAWWQKSWNAFTEKLFATLGTGATGSGGATLNPDTAPAVPDDEATGEKGYSIIDLFVVLKDGTWSFITGIVSTAYDGFDGFVDSVSHAGSFFEFYDEDSEQSIFFIPLEEGETIWD